MSLDDDEEESVSSDKESDNSDSNVSLSPPVVAKKKNSKVMPEITPIKEDLFTKTIIAFLMDEDIQIGRSGKNNNSISKYKINKKISNNNLQKPIKNIEINKDRLKGKRSSLCPGFKFQFKNKNRHVTFTQKKSANYDKKEINSNKDFKDNDDAIDNNSNDKTNTNNVNNLKRINLYDTINNNKNLK